MGNARDWYCFGPFQFDSHNGQLWRAGEPIQLRRKTVALLAFLLEHRGEILGRSEILSILWPNLERQEGALNSCIREIRLALGERREATRYIESLYGRGFRFTAEVTVSPFIRLHRDRSGATGATTTPFVGRAVALSELTKALDDALDQHSRVALVHGPGGIGKTRLVRELRAAAEERGAHVLELSVADEQHHLGFALWGDVAEHLAGTLTNEELSATLSWGSNDISLVVPAIAERIGEPQPFVVLDPAVARARFFAAMATFLKNFSTAHPLVLILDNLHKASTGALALLESVIRSSEGQALFFVLTFREQEAHADPTLRSLLQTWQAGTNVLSVQLEGLEDAAVSELIESITQHALDADNAARIARATDGNPFFVLEVAASMQQVERRDAARADDNSPNLARFIDARVQGLSTAAQELLAVAAVAGDRFEARVVARAAGLDRTALLRLLNEAVEADFVSELSDEIGRFRFQHDLLRDTLMQRLGDETRRQMHARIGAALEGAAGVSSTTLPQLAHHYSEAGASGVAVKALEYCARAGEEALAAYAHEGALELLSRAWQLIEAGTDDADIHRRNVLENLAEVLVRMGRIDEAEPIAMQLYTLGKAHGEPESMAKGAIVRARTYIPFFPRFGTEHIAQLERALHELPPQPTLLRGLVAARLAVARLTDHDDGERRRAGGREALAIARALPLRRDRQRILHESMLAFWDADHLEERIALTREIEADSASPSGGVNPSTAGWNAMNLAAKGEWRQLQSLLDALPTPFRDFPNHGGQRFALRLRMLLADLHGNVPEMLDIQRQILLLPDTTSELALLTKATMDLQLSRATGEFTHSADLPTVLQQIMPTYPVVRFIQPFFLCYAGRSDEARTQFEAIMRDGFRDRPPRNEALGWLPAMLTLGETCALLDAREEAPLLYRILEPHAAQWAILHLAFGVLGAVERTLGRLADVMNDLERGRRHFANVILVCRREGAISELARAQIDFARMLLRRDSNDAQGRELQQAALAIAERYGLGGIRVRAAHVLGDLS